MISPTKGPGSPASVYRAAAQPGTAAKAKSTSSTDAQFDQVSISRTSQDHLFHQQMVSRLVGETRTAHTTSDIQRVKEDVNNGSYQINANEIAARMMLEGAF